MACLNGTPFAERDRLQMFQRHWPHGEHRSGTLQGGRRSSGEHRSTPRREPGRARKAGPRPRPAPYRGQRDAAIPFATHESGIETMSAFRPTGPDKQS